MSVERIQADPAALERWATNHEGAAQTLEGARSDGAKILEAADSWGPIFSEARRAAQEVIEAREQALAQQAQRHRNMADQLRRGGAAFAAMNEDNAADLGDITT
ncbi:type VII secretion target [Mycobacterium attenuatum]|uniref:type VII secretion target n=1 Tax=Mycobacterium attenuatum TaxID=2341086 RepID=UPI000F042F65|nr:type VII secretion target [Mycobacterium attenuatum]VBA62423.1 hypothetical protein LAUMK41_05814 [Mycobacterium attenuatum]